MQYTQDRRYHGQKLEVVRTCNIACMSLPCVFTSLGLPPQYNGRGTIYAWLRVHHGDVVRCREVEQRPWSVLITEMVSDGVRREDGLEPTAKNVSRVWKRVCRDVAAEVAAATPKRVPPSRISPEWRPTIVPPPPMFPTPQPTGSAGALAAAERKRPADPTLSPEAQAEMDKLDRLLEDADSRRLRL